MAEHPRGPIGYALPPIWRYPRHPHKKR
ncbi:protein of unknown function (plasmid) [Azospirillum baldaniorum]|uniref:Uncharacterized protein n=1 Tax=Azospirillum baldaniorum TaxID=1064539 RepID=A0A9P1NND0_9PROT|nr:protein of unknown function [Azospirillum baldaniorum]